MSVSRSIGSLIVRMVADGLPGYKADMEAAAAVTQSANTKIEKSTIQTAEAQKKAEKAVEDVRVAIDKQVKSFEVQAATYGMSTRQAELFKIASMGASDAQMTQANAALRSVEYMDKAGAAGERMGVAIKYGAIAAAGAVVAAAVAFEKLIGGVSKYQDLAEQTGGDPAGLASLRTSADVGGVSVDSLAQAAIRLQKNLAKVTDDSVGVGKALQSIGIEVENFKNLRADDQMRAIGKALNQYADDGNKVAVIQGILGTGSASMLSSLKELGNEQSTSNKLTNEQIALADDYKDAQARSKSELIQMAEVMAVNALPALTALTGAAKDVILEFMGVGTGASELERNKAIQDWAKSGAESAAFLADALLALVNVAKVASSLVSMFFADMKVASNISITPSGIARDMFDDTRKKEIEQGIKDRNEVYRKGEVALNTLLQDGDKFRRALDKNFANQAAKRAESASSAGGDKPSISYNTASAQRGGSASTKVSDYTRMAEAMGKTNTLAEQELAFGGKLAASDKYRIEQQSKIQSLFDAHKISLQEYNQLMTQLGKTTGTMYQVEKMLWETDAIKKNTEAVDKANEAAAKSLDGLIASNEQLRLNNETIGLTTEKLNKLTLERMDAAIAEEKLTLIGKQNQGASAQEISTLERKIALLEKQRSLTQSSQVKTAYAGVVASTLPETAKYDSQDASGVIGAETAKVAAYNATARAAIDAEQARQQAILQTSLADGTATEAMLANWDALIAKNEELRSRLDMNFSIAGMDDAASKLEGISKITGKMGEGWSGATRALSGFGSGLKTISAAQKNASLSAQEQTAATVGGYGDMVGAAAEFFDKGSEGYEVLKTAEQAFRAVQLAMSIAAMVQGTAEATTSQANSAGNAVASTIAGVAKAFEQMGVWGFVGAAAIIAFMASMGSGSGGGGGGGGSAGGASADGNYVGTGSTVNEHGQVSSLRGGNGYGGGESTAAQRDTEEAQAAADAADAINKVNLSMRKLKDGATALEQDLIDVKQATQGAGQAQYDLATRDLDSAETATYNYNAALRGQIAVLLDAANGTSNASKNMKSLANDTVSLSIDLMKASGDIAGARNAQRALDTAGYTSDEVAVYNYNQSLKDQIEAYSAGSSAADDAAQAERDLAQTRYDIAGKLNVLLGRQTQLQFDRATELAGTTDEASISMLNLIYQLEDLNTAVDASYAKLERSIEAERTLADTRLKSAQDLVNALNSAKSANTEAIDRDAARAQILMYTAIAKAGGNLPTASILKPALDSLAKPSQALFKTFSEYAIDQAQAANDISDLSDYAEKQVSEAQQTLDRLDLQLETAKQALDVLKGVDNSVMGVSAAVAQFESSMLALSNAKANAPAFSYAAPAASYGGGSGGGGLSIGQRDAQFAVAITAHAAVTTGQK